MNSSSSALDQVRAGAPGTGNPLRARTLSKLRSRSQFPPSLPVVVGANSWSIERQRTFYHYQEDEFVRRKSPALTCVDVGIVNLISVDVSVLICVDVDKNR